MAFGNAIKKSNIVENWLFQFGYYNGDAHGNGDGGFSAVTQADGTANLCKGAISDAAATSIDIDDTTVFVVGDFIKIESEILKITALTDGDTLAVTRGEMGTTAATHDDDDVLYWQNFFPIAFSDTTYNAVFYHGAVLNKPSIRESIDLANATAKTSNISVTIPDFKYQGSAISKELFGGTNNYINQEVKVLSQIDADTPNQIGSFRLVDVSTDGNKINLSLASHRPWDYITIPQAKTAKNNYFPVVYGNFTKNASTRDSQAFCSSKALYPCPVEQRSSSYLKGLQPQVLSGDARLHLYEEEIDAFVPLTKSDNTYRDTAVVDGDGHSTIIENDLFRGFITKGFIEQGSSDNEFTNPAFAVDDQNTAETSTDASKSFNTINGADSTDFSLVLDCPQIVGTISEAKIAVVYERITTLNSGTAVGLVYVRDLADNDLISGYNYSGGTNTTSGTSNDVTLVLSQGQLPTNYGAKIVNAVVSGTYNLTVTLNISDARLKVKANLDFANNKEAAIQTLNGVKMLYCGADGLTESWSGLSGAITEVHQAHRDLLIRFADMTTDTPTGWSDLDSAKDGWTIRWWTLDEIELKEVLDQMAYEGGFIFRFKSDGTPQYIHIPNSPSTDQTLSKHDIADMGVKATPFSELITKREISYEKHPAESRYLSTITTEDTTNNPRQKWGVKSKENIEDVKLDMLVGDVGDANPGNDNPNDSFAGYYNKIFGDIKLLISCAIVNPIYYSLEVGDVIEFDENNMFPETPLGYNSATWNNLQMMITSTNRTPGKLKITAREI